VHNPSLAVHSRLHFRQKNRPEKLIKRPELGNPTSFEAAVQHFPTADSEAAHEAEPEQCMMRSAMTHTSVAQNFSMGPTKGRAFSLQILLLAPDFFPFPWLGTTGQRCAERSLPVRFLRKCFSRLPYLLSTSPTEASTVQLSILVPPNSGDLHSKPRATILIHLRNVCK
jgi:hypothetical protein